MWVPTCTMRKSRETKEKVAGKDLYEKVISGQKPQLNEGVTHGTI